MENRIFVEDYRLALDIGVLEEERGVPQAVEVSVTVDVAAPPAGDAMEGVLSYVALVEAVEAVAAGPRLELLETFAEAVAARCLAHAQARAVRVRVAKLDRLDGRARLGVEIARTR